MAAQVDVQPGELGLTVAAAGLHLSPLSDSSNKSCIEIPSVDKSNAIASEPSKPVSTQKARLTPKPFVVERNLTIKPILAPKPQSKPRPESTRMAGHRPDLPSTPKPNTKPLLANFNRPAPTFYKTSNKFNSAQTTKPVTQPFKSTSPFDPDDQDKPTSSSSAKRQKPVVSSFVYSKSLAVPSAAEWCGTTAKEKETNVKSKKKVGASITRAKSMGFLDEVGFDKEEKDEAKHEVSVPLRPKSSRPRPVSAIFPDSLNKVEKPVPTPRRAGRRPLSADLTSKFESIGLSLHRKSNNVNTQESAPAEKVLPQKIEDAPNPALKREKKTEENAVKETEEENQRPNIKSCISHPFDSSSLSVAGSTGQGLDPQSPVQSNPETETSVGVKQLIKQLTEDPTQRPTMKPTPKPRPLSIDLTKRFSSEKSPDLNTVTEAADRHQISKVSQREDEELANTPNDNKILNNLKESEEQLKDDSPSSEKETSNNPQNGGPAGELHTLRAFVFDIERHIVIMSEEKKSASMAKNLSRNASFKRETMDGALPPFAFKEPASPSSSLCVVPAFDTVQAIEEKRAVSESVPSAQWEDKAMTLRSRRSDTSRPGVEWMDQPQIQPPVEVMPVPRFLRVGALPKWTMADLNQDLNLEKGTQKEFQRDVQVDKEGDRQRWADEEEDAAAHNYLTREKEEQLKPRATYFALTGQMQEPSSPKDLGTNFGEMTVPSDYFPVRSALGGSQGKILSVKRNLSLEEALERSASSHQQLEAMMRRQLSPMDTTSHTDKQTKEKIIEVVEKTEQQIEKENQETEILNLQERVREQAKEAQRQLEEEKKKRGLERIIELERQELLEIKKNRLKEKERSQLHELERPKQKENVKEAEKLKLMDQEMVKEPEKQMETERERQKQKQQEIKNEIQQEQEGRDLERQREKREKLLGKERQRKRDEDRQRELDKEQQLLEMQKQKQKMEEIEKKELERQQLELQKEKEKQWLVEEAEKIKLVALEKEWMRFKELEKERARQKELEHQREVEREKQKEMQRKRWLEMEKLRQTDEKERHWHLEKEKEELERLREIERERLQEQKREQAKERQRDEERQKQLDRERLQLEMQQEKHKKEEEKRELERQQLELQKQKQKEFERQLLAEEAEKLRKVALEQELLKLKELEKEREKQREIELQKEVTKQMLRKLENQLDLDKHECENQKLSKRELKEKMEKEEAEKIRQVAKQQEAERRRLKEKQRKDEERLKLESSAMRPKVLDLDSVLRDELLHKASSHHGDPSMRWREPNKPAILDIDSPKPEAQPSPNKDLFPVSDIQELDAAFGFKSNSVPKRDLNWKVPPQATAVWTMSPQDPWELQPVEMTVDKPMVELRKSITAISPTQPFCKQNEQQQNRQNNWAAFLNERFHTSPLSGTEEKIRNSLGAFSGSPRGEEIWVPRESQSRSPRRSQGSQELNRMRSRSMSRKSARSNSSVEESLSRMRSRSANREHESHSWVQQTQNSEEERKQKHSETPVRETDSQYGTWETELRSDDSLTSITPSSDSFLSLSQRKPSPPTSLGENTLLSDRDTLDGLPPPSSSERQPLTFPDAPTTLLDNSALRSKAQLGKKRAPRMRPTRAVRQSAAPPAATTEDWLYRDSTEAKPENPETELESEKPTRGVDVGLTVPSQLQRVAVFPVLDPSALKAQLKRRSDSDNQTDGPAPSPSQPTRSPKSPFLPQATRVLPPLGGKENGEEDSPKWLKELKSKKRFSQYENENN